MNRIDLHTHTTASDGTATPEELAELAKTAGLTAIAVTDHDTMDGVTRAIHAGEHLGVEVIPGIEFSVEWKGNGVHLLGYGLDPDATALAEVRDWVLAQRRQRNEGITERMRRDGVSVDLDELEAAYPGATIGRPHFARLLVDQGRAQSVSDAFARLLDTGKPYYLPRKRLSLHQAAEVIRAAGGVAVLAHPLQYSYSPERRKDLVRSAAESGCEGLEVYYTGYDARMRDKLLVLVEEFDLFATGGSDFHGSVKPDIALGTGRRNLVVPESALVNLKRHIAARQAEGDD